MRPRLFDRGMTTRGLRAPLLFVLATGILHGSPAADALAAEAPRVASGAASVAPAGLAASLQPWRGGATPALALRDAAGTEHRLTALRGKVVLVNFWATWCEPCRAEMPSLMRTKAQLGDALEVLAVNLGESDRKVAAFLETLVPAGSVNGRGGMTVLFDRDMGVARAWKAHMAPASYLVRPDGRIAHVLLGEADWAAPDMLQLLRSLATGGAGTGPGKAAPRS